MPVSKMGAMVQYCGHDAMFAADIFEIDGAAAVYANGPIEKNLIRPADPKMVTHHLVDFPQMGMWKPARGVFVVPKTQVKVLK